MHRSFGRIRANQLRQQGVKVSAGPWAVYADRSQTEGGGIIVALARVAGPAVTRSRIRRIAREVFATTEAAHGLALEVLLFARSDVRCLPRRQVRADLLAVIGRVPGAMARREARSDSHA